MDKARILPCVLYLILLGATKEAVHRGHKCHVERGSFVELTCKAHGFPTPQIDWYHNGRIITGQKHVKNKQSKVDRNYVIKYAEPKHTGNYSCSATNDVCNITVDPPIRIVVKQELKIIAHAVQNVSVALGSNVILKCQAEGYPDPKITWLRNRTRISRHTTRVEINGTKKISELVIKDARLEDTGHYTCEARNKFEDVTAEPPILVFVKPATTTQAVTTPNSVTCPNYTPATAATKNHGRFNVLKKDDTEQRCPGSSLAIAACTSFVAGILTVLAALFLLRCLRTGKCCFGKNDDARNKIMTGTNQSVTEQLNHDNITGHAYAAAQNAYEAMEGTHMHTAAENPYQTLDYIKTVRYSAENEHVYTGIVGQAGSDKSPAEQQKSNDTGQTSGTENTYFVLEKEGSGEAGAKMSLQASGTDNTYFVLEKEEQMPPQASGTENTYFVLEKEEQMPPQASGTENTYFVPEKDDQMPPQASGTENTYFVLEKEARVPPQTGKRENTYFVLEKESSSNAQKSPKANGSDNAHVVLEKEAQHSSKTDGTDNSKTGH